MTDRDLVAEILGITVEAEDGGTTDSAGPPDTAVKAVPVSEISTKVVNTAEFRARLSEFLEHANHQPVTIASPGARARAVLVSSDFFDRASDALYKQPYTRPPLSRMEEIMEEAARILRPF